MFINNIYDFFKKINYKRILPAILSPVLFLFISISGFAASSSVNFAVEVHNYSEDSYIKYGSSSVQIDSSLRATPSLIFDLVLDNSFLLDFESGYLNLNFVIHQTVAGTVRLRCDFYDYNNSLMGTVYRNRTLDQAKWNSHTVNIISDVIPNVTQQSAKNIARIRVTCTWPSSSSYSETLTLSIGAVGFNSDGSLESVIAAINQQTSDLQQSIEDQYGGDPGSSFPVDDIITQHNEKMGVLSFGSDALMQVLGLLSPDQSLSSELVFPSMSLTIAGQRNKVQLWPEYRFDLNELKQHWPKFVGLMQSLTTALVWIFVLRYCYRVFEKYFLAGGGN